MTDKNSERGKKLQWEFYSKMSRLDRLFALLSTSTSASARNLAAQQLGEVQKTYPDELHRSEG